MFTLGFAESGGLEGEFSASGPYQFTRNPQYAGITLLLIGLTLIVTPRQVRILSILGCLCFELALFLEEPWLEEKCGDDKRNGDKG